MYKGSVMVIEKDNLDFKHNPRDFAKIVDRIDQTLFGLFSPPEPEPPKLGGWGSEQSQTPLPPEPPKLGGWGSEQSQTPLP